MEAVEVKAGSDGKPGALPPEKDKVVYDLAKKVIGRGVLLNSEGGSSGDGDLDESSSNSPYAKAARRISAESLIARGFDVISEISTSVQNS